MSFLTEWLTTIVLFILFAIVIDMLLPSSSMQKYAKMVVSLLLIVVMLTPIFKLFKTDPEVIFEYLTKNGQSESADIKNQINSKKIEIQASLKKVWDTLSLKKSEYEVLKQFGETLGIHDRISQQKHIKLALTHLEASEADAEQAQAKNEKMIKSLGFLAGLLLILLLM